MSEDLTRTYPINSKLLAARLNALLREQGVTLSQVAKKAGVHRTTLTRWMQGDQAEAFMPTIVLVAEQVGLKPEDLIAKRPEEIGTFKGHKPAGIDDDGDYVIVSKGTNAAELLDRIVTKFGATHEILFLQLTPKNSFTFELLIHPDDIMRLIQSFLRGDLEPFGVTSVIAFAGEKLEATGQYPFTKFLPAFAPAIAPVTSNSPDAILVDILLTELSYKLWRWLTSIATGLIPIPSAETLTALIQQVEMLQYIGDSELPTSSDHNSQESSAKSKHSAN